MHKLTVTDAAFTDYDAATPSVYTVPICDILDQEFMVDTLHEAEALVRTLSDCQSARFNRPVNIGYILRGD